MICVQMVKYLSSPWVGIIFFQVGILVLFLFCRRLFLHTKSLRCLSIKFSRCPCDILVCLEFGDDVVIADESFVKDLHKICISSKLWEIVFVVNRKLRLLWWRGRRIRENKASEWTGGWIDGWKDWMNDEWMSEWMNERVKHDIRWWYLTIRSDLPC